MGLPDAGPTGTGSRDGDWEKKRRVSSGYFSGTNICVYIYIIDNVCIYIYVYPIYPIFKIYLIYPYIIYDYLYVYLIYPLNFWRELHRFSCDGLMVETFAISEG